ncbi:capsular polysaccharide biosynthesis protein [Caldimonas thermodepolymerans]|uniref:Capsular polysaccharide export protein n=2 Tax=Caldimonas thermodepolymerans TaxID=215580 RepID=A0AA46DCP3_9BURK|nr:capsular polysaccharide biosynthesis protein [Caldimonas thermodepolymerans]TCP05770.1 capsular polysaccharide export protein [Caldimonas thermodepolymerans]
MSRKPRLEGLDGVLAWGRKPSARVAEAYASRYGLPVWRAEDGFLRSVGLGNQDPPLSIVLDDLGIYYDATTPSRLETLIARPHGPDERMRAASLRVQWCAGRLSKYNHAREVPPPRQGPYILAVDQTYGDASIAHGMADAGSFVRMLEAALDEHPDLPVVLKVHPDVIAGRKRGHFDTLTPGQAARVHLLASDAHPCALLASARAVYTVTSQMGFEALLWDRPVRCFGMPFYAGWGLTRDELPAPGRRSLVTVDDLVHAALIEYPRYLDPETGKRCEAERLAEWMSLQRRMRERFPAEVHALKFSCWKKPVVRAFFNGSRVRFVRQVAEVPAGATLAVWGNRDPGAPAPMRARETRPCSLVHLEDGFLRSVGLGADLVRPLSWVMDRTGMYYDATRPSDLETLLQTTVFDDALLHRARALRQRIVAEGLTKYNVGAGTWRRPPEARRVVLVPGQVESDAAIAWGAPGVRTNIDLLHAARRAAPDAYLVYKPHPDVVAGLRKPGHKESEATRIANEIVVDVPMQALLAEADEVHVLTSLAGFEALLRGKPVRCEGLPFYAGWGLTTDAHRCERRTRQLTLDELVAGALILYPTYVSRTTKAFTTPERALDELLAWRAQSGRSLPLWRKALRAALSLRKR